MALTVKNNAVSTLVEEVADFSSFCSMDCEARNRSIDEDTDRLIAEGREPAEAWAEAAFSKTPLGILKREEDTRRAVAWVQVVEKLWPGGKFELPSDLTDLSIENLRGYFGNTRNGTGLKYSTIIAPPTGPARSVDLSLYRFNTPRGSRLVATIDFDWANPTDITPSSRDEITFGTSGNIAAEIASGSMAFLRQTIERYIFPLSDLGIDLHFHAGSPRRLALYKSIVERCGFREVPDLPAPDIQALYFAPNLKR